MYLLVAVFIVACIKFAIWFVRVCIAGALWIVGTVIECIGRGMDRRNRKRIVAARHEMEQAKQIERQRRDYEKRQREKLRFEWEKEKMEWARQKEADRRADLEYKRSQRGKGTGSEKQRKAEFERQQAREDLEHYSVQREELQRLYGTYENRFRLAKNTKQAAAAYKQMMETDNRLRAVDKRIAKAEYIIAG